MNNLQSFTTTQLNNYFIIAFLANWIFKVYIGRKELSPVEVSGRRASNFLIVKDRIDKKGSGTVIISCQPQLSIILIKISKKKNHDLHWKATFGITNNARKDRKEIRRKNKIHIK